MLVGGTILEIFRWWTSTRDGVFALSIYSTACRRYASGGTSKLNYMENKVVEELGHEWGEGVVIRGKIVRIGVVSGRVIAQARWG